MGLNCLCCETPVARDGITRKMRFEDKSFSSNNKIWIKQLTKSIVKDIVESSIGEIEGTETPYKLTIFGSEGP